MCLRISWPVRSLVLIASLASCLVCSLNARAQSTGPYFGFTPFPYDNTDGALNDTYRVILPNSTVVGIHLDDGVPWTEALGNEAFPAKIQTDWNDTAKRLDPNKPVYLGLAPLEKNRMTLAHASGASASKWSNTALNDLMVKKAYLSYARRAVQQFHPTFLNIGIEAGDLAQKSPKDWPKFEELFDYVKGALKREYPTLKVGISFGLHTLMNPAVAKAVKPLVNKSDYLCLSFYPYMSSYWQSVSNGSIDQSWIQPLSWVRSYTNKPVAICETGYSTEPVNLDAFNLKLIGDANSQAAYVKYLLNLARKDNYLFVIWFLAVDYDKLYAKIQDPNGANRIWKNIGMFDSNLRPKPAWSVWQQNLATMVLPPAGSSGAGTEVDSGGGSTNDVVGPGSTSVMEITFKSDASDQIICGPNNNLRFNDLLKSLDWSLTLQANQWNWCVKPMNATLIGSRAIKLAIRADSPGVMIFKLEELNNESHYASVNVSDIWQDVELQISDFKLDDATRVDGALDVNLVKQIVMAVPPDAKKVGSSRTISIRQIVFHK